MPVDCQRSTSGGKGNLGMFFERTPNICAAGLPSAQPDDRVSDALQHYLLKDEVDSLIGDAIIPPKPPRPLPPLRHPLKPDMRNTGVHGQVSSLINPPIKTKFQTLVEDFKETSYTSYWRKRLGAVPDPVPMLPEGLDVFNTTFGRKLPDCERLYDVIMPKEPLIDKTPASKHAGMQMDRNYCKPAFNPDLTYGRRSKVDKRGIYAKCCLTDDTIVEGNGNRAVYNTIQSRFQEINKPRLGKVLAPNDNISNVPDGHSFGKLSKPDNLAECLSFCKINPEREYFRKCISHLNTIRKCLSTRFLPNFFYDFYLRLKYFDCDKNGWLPKNIVYDACSSKLIRFDQTMIEHLLSSWNALDGSNIYYKFFVQIINYREPISSILHIPDFPEECIDFRTTYSELVKSCQQREYSPMAGVPSGRYFDLDYPITPENCCKADRACLPHESDVMACITPSIFTLLHVNHRDMYAKREPEVVRKIFEAAGERFTDEKFDEIWKEAKNYHSQGWVCYETFRQALRKISSNETSANNAAS